MLRRSAVSVFALVVAFALGMMVSNRPATVSAQPAGRGKCVGLVAIGSLVCRAFEDGTVEQCDIADAGGGPWHKLGK
jgi:hypothetical protein